jgi:vanillate O-demethylase monooxygenase subunit
VASYPVVELDSFIWVWIGDPALADREAIPRAPWLDHPDWTAVSGMEPLAARWSLLVDNLLDLSHETYLHAGYIGTPEVAGTPITTEVDEAARVVRVSRRMADAECPGFYRQATGITGRITRWQDIEYHPPCLYLLHSRVAPIGVLPNDDGTDPDAFHVEVVYAITPSTESTTYDFWAVARDFARDDESISRGMHDNNRTVVLQDVVALDLLETVLASDPPGAQELSINIDTGGLAARRMIAAMAAEGERPAAGQAVVRAAQAR